MSADPTFADEPPIPAIVAAAIIVFLAATSPAFDTDDATFFTYLNNVVGAAPLYFYTGYVHLIPQVVTYALSGLPLAVQPWFYPVLPILLALALYRHLTRLLQRRGSPLEASMLALAIIFVLRIVEPVLWANISNAMWLALLLSTVVVIGHGFDRAPYSWPAAAGIVISGLAFPPAALLAILLAMRAVAAPSLRRQSLVMAVLIAGGHLAVAMLTPEHVFNGRVLEAPLMFASSFREHKLSNLIAVVSLLAVAALCLWAWRRRQDRPHIELAGAVATIGFGSVALYVMSSRFARYDGGFEPRYVIPVLFCALTGVSWMVLTMPRTPRRSRLIGAMAGAAITFATIFFYGNLRGPMELALMKYRFVADAAVFRRDCRPDDVSVFEADAASPIVFCRPRTFPEGENYLKSFTPSIGVENPDDTDEDRPYVISPRPLF